MSKDKTRVFLVDDHNAIREALRMWVSRTEDLEVVGEAADVEGAQRGIPGSDPDIVVADLQLGGDSGITVCEYIRINHPGVKSLVLTGMQDHSRLMEVIAAGASGYVLKTAEMTEIVGAIRAVAAGETVLAAAAAMPTPTGTGEPGLSEQEEHVLELVAAGLTNQQIAHRLSIANQTVKNHVSKVLMKLGLQSRTQAAIFVERHRSGRS